MQAQVKDPHPDKPCEVCGCDKVRNLFSTIVLGAYAARVAECPSCGFQFFPNSEEWIQEAYSSPIANTDTGIVARSLSFHKIIASFLTLNRTDGCILDWGSGSGLLVRLLRDSGHDCFGFEPFTDPVLAAGYTFNSEDVAIARAPFRAVLAIEVLEHISEPKRFMENILSMTDTLIFTTELLDNNRDGKDWWYYSTETGQHISFHTSKSLAHVAAEQGCLYYTCRNRELHIFTRIPSDMRCFKLIAGRRRSSLIYPLARLVAKLNGRSSLTMLDHLAAKEYLSVTQ